MTDQPAAAVEHNPILDAFRTRFVRNPEVNELTPFGFFEAGWNAGVSARGSKLRQSTFASGFDAGRARAEAEVQRLTEQLEQLRTQFGQYVHGAETENALLREVVVAVRHFRGAVNDAMAHQSRCQDSPCDWCDRTVFVQDAAESALFDSLDRLDAAEKARTAAPQGPHSEPSSAPPQPEQAT